MGLQGRASIGAVDPNAVIAATLLVLSAVSTAFTVLSWLLARDERRAAGEEPTEAIAGANLMMLVPWRRSFLAARRFSLLIVTVALIVVTLFVGYLAIYMPA
jgi:hypothetical protein